MKATKWAKRILPVLLAITVGCAAFGGCRNNAPLSGAEEEPPFVRPDDDKDPVVPPVTDPDVDEPKDDNSDPIVPPVTDPETDEPKDDDSDPVVPPATDPDADEEQRKELTKEQEDQLIVNNILEATLEKARLSLGKSAVIHKVLVVDYKIETDGNYIYLLVDDTNKLAGDCYDLIKMPIEQEVNRENLLANDFTTKNSNKPIFTFVKKNINDSERTQKIYNKLRADGVLEQTSTPLAMAITEMGGGVDIQLQCSCNMLSLYTLSKEELEYTRCYIKNDSGTKDYISDYLLNGTISRHYREAGQYYYKFSENAIKDFDNGLTVREI